MIPPAGAGLESETVNVPLVEGSAALTPLVTDTVVVGVLPKLREKSSTANPSSELDASMSVQRM